jgi:hypothetical protein
MLEREYCIEEPAPTIYAFLIILCAIVVVACSWFLVALCGAQFRMKLRTDIDVLGDWRESEVHLNANSIVITSLSNLETTQKNLSRLKTVVDQTMILWPSGPWDGETFWRFRGTYCLHLHGDWVGFSGCWSYTENKLCWLSRMIWGCLAGHS